jgi:hypothetical protein
MIPIILSLEKYGVDIVIHDSLCKKLRKNDERVLSVHSKQQRELSMKNGFLSGNMRESRAFYG